MAQATDGPSWMDTDDLPSEDEQTLNLSDAERELLINLYGRIEKAELEVSDDLNAGAVTLQVAQFINSGYSPKKAIARVLSDHGMGKKNTRFTYEQGAELADTSPDSIRLQAKDAQSGINESRETYFQNIEDRPMHLVTRLIGGMRSHGSYDPRTGGALETTSPFIYQYDDIASISEDELLIDKSDLPRFVIFWETRRFNGVHRGDNAEEMQTRYNSSPISIEQMLMSSELELSGIRTTRHASQEDLIDELYAFFQENDTGYVWDAVREGVENALSHYAFEYEQ